MSLQRSYSCVYTICDLIKFRHSSASNRPESMAYAPLFIIEQIYHERLIIFWLPFSADRRRHLDWSYRPTQELEYEQLKKVEHRYDPFIFDSVVNNTRLPVASGHRCFSNSICRSESSRVRSTISTTVRWSWIDWIARQQPESRAGFWKKLALSSASLIFLMASFHSTY